MLAAKSILFIYIPLIFVLECKSKDYCSADTCNNNKQHTLCKFQSSNPAAKCSDFELMLKNVDDKQAILNKINSRRNKVASGDIKSLPPATSMLKLEWNADLELSAQRWANQCVQHNVPDIKDFCRDLGPIMVEQNIATILGEAPGLSPSALVDVWYMELLNFNATLLSKYKPSRYIGLSHYDYFTQLVWAKSSEVGCGGIKFKEISHDENGKKNRTIYRLVCNFAPAGNLQNYSVYTEGVPCSQCPSNYTCDPVHKALCGLQTPVKTIDRQQLTTEFADITTSASNSYDNLDIEIDFIESIVGSSTMNTTKEFKKPFPNDMQLDSVTPTMFDYFSNLHDLTKHGTNEMSTKSHVCKNGFAVDEFIALLKNKLSNDPMFKEMLATKSLFNNGNSESMYTDQSVVDFASKIYSKKVSATTSKATENDLINSTLLVDLVEAVIFRSGEKHPASIGSEVYTQSLEVSPIKIQAELAEVKPNHDFTGHYFFPEDEEETITESTESYYDSFSLPVSDVVREIEDIKKLTTVKDFLDEILESDVIIESTSTSSLLSPDDLSVYKTGHNVMKKFLENIGDKREKHLHDRG